MLKALPYLMALLAVGLSIYSAYKWGYNDARADNLELTNQALAKSAQHIIDEQSKLQIIEDVINKDKDTTIIKSPVLMRTLVRLRECEGKPKC
ncbi:MAG: hypothetical protein ACOVOQ_04565 [Flavobacterium sp.]